MAERQRRNPEDEDCVWCRVQCVSRARHGWLWTSVSIEHHQSSQTQSLRVSSELMVGWVDRARAKCVLRKCNESLVGDVDGETRVAS